MEWKIKASCHPGSFRLQLTIHPLIPYAFPPHQITHLQALGAAGNRLFRFFFAAPRLSFRAGITAFQIWSLLSFVGYSILRVWPVFMWISTFQLLRNFARVATCNKRNFDFHEYSKRTRTLPRSILLRVFIRGGVVRIHRTTMTWIFPLHAKLFKFPSIYCEPLERQDEEYILQLLRDGSHCWCCWCRRGCSRIWNRSRSGVDMT